MDVAVDAAVRPVRSVGAGGHEAHVPPMGVVSGCREKQSMAHRPECDSARCAQGPGPRIEGDFNHNPLLFWTKSANIEAFGAVHSDKWPYQHPGSRKKRGLYEKFEGGFFGGGGCGRCDDFDARDRLYICHFRPKKAGGQAKKIGGYVLYRHARRRACPDTTSDDARRAARWLRAAASPKLSACRAGGHRPRRRPGRLVPWRIQCALYWQLSCEM